MAVFTLFLGRNSTDGNGGGGYSLFVFAGLLPWIFFANGLSSGGQSIVGNQNLVTKVYFPRLLIPMGAVVAGLVDLTIAFVLLLIMLPFYGIAPGWSVLWLPVIVGVLALSAFGVSTLLAALTVAYRDFRHVLPFLVQIWMFATPAIYLQGSVSDRTEPWLPLNPAHGLVASFRQAVLGQPVDLAVLGISSVVGLALLLLGCLYFRRVERSFADVI
jgi:lipopolysaccharide transport system permease protein